jgi:type I restriction enzyme S subunit
LRSDFITTYLTGQHNNTSNSHNRIDIDDFMNIEVTLPSLEEQKRLAKVVTDLDSQIDNLTAINRNLEQAARQLYDYWFVQFDFPNEEGKPYKSSGGEMVWNERLKRNIPKGWECKRIEDIENDIVTGKTPSTSDSTNFGDDFPFVTIDDIRGCHYVFQSARMLSKKGATSQPTKFLPKGSLLCSCIGTTGVIGFAGCEIQTNQQINSIRFSRKENSIFLYYGLLLHFSFSKAKTGNILPNMSKGEFSDIPIIYPHNEILMEYHKKVMPLFDVIFNNEANIIELQSLWNELLPMLLNGQVSVGKENVYDFKPVDLQLAAEPGSEVNCDLSH